MARADYERFLAELEQVLERMAAINVAGIEPGIVDELTLRMRDVVGLKQKARFVGGTEG